MLQKQVVACLSLVSFIPQEGFAPALRGKRVTLPEDLGSGSWEKQHLGMEIVISPGFSFSLSISLPHSLPSSLCLPYVLAEPGYIFLVWFFIFLILKQEVEPDGLQTLKIPP